MGVGWKDTSMKLSDMKTIKKSKIFLEMEVEANKVYGHSYNSNNLTSAYMRGVEDLLRKLNISTEEKSINKEI